MFGVRCGENSVVTARRCTGAVRLRSGAGVLRASTYKRRAGMRSRPPHCVLVLMEAILGRAVQWIPSIAQNKGIHRPCNKSLPRFIVIDTV
ncbi:hypothetical protein J6590_028352 [Homalodisca vitripennis]|nr:hypothetical protein J6590_028352 [Homalodisca vitripennis]